MQLGVRGGAIGLVVWLCHSAAPQASAQCPDPSARIIHIDRQVDHKPVSSNAFVSASLNLDICLGDSIRTGERSRTTLIFVDGTRLVVDQNTEWVMRVPVQPGRTLVDLIRGAILFFTRQPRALGVRTPFVNAAVEGTEFLIRVESDRTVISVFEGTVVAANAIGSLTLASGESAVALQGRAPERQVIVRPRDGVQWALYYQPILPADSFEALEKVPEAQRDARFYVRRAGLLLEVGRLDEARAALEQALARDPNNSDAHALQAIIAVALNEPADALASGREAVKRNPGSVEARMALSYALQANFQLDAARDELLTAVADHPDDPRAWSRLAELWLSLGYLDRSLEAAERAVALVPTDARAQTVMGFASLARVDIADARTAFEQAIMLDSGSPLARLGLGLAKIRAGHLAEGRGDIEIAAALNPDDPIVRSYLGKAYFEERREPLPGPQFDRAKRIDPRDPTPWFYDAIRKQTINRPVEALRDLDTSIELNDNRAVYRSRLMLDEDLAARSASLGQIYRDLGFGQLALVEAWKSLSVDPRDFSAHRLLAEIYSTLPRHDTARVSALLQSQLRQPLNVTPIQPQLAESNLFIVEDLGPSRLAFNEFNPLFMRNRLSFQTHVVAGNNDLFGDDVAVSWLQDSFSVSLGQYHVETDGVRENNDLDQSIYNAFLQASLSHRTSVQAEWRRTTFDHGDLFLRFNPDTFVPGFRQSDESTLVRVGLRHAFTPRSDVIANVAVHKQDFSTVLEEAFENHTDLDGYTVEAQHAYQSSRLKLMTGFGYIAVDRTDQFTPASSPEPLPEVETEIRQTSVYLYSLVSISPDVSVTLGTTVDLFDAIVEKTQANPKIGVLWTPASATTVRAGALRTLKRALPTDQTIEPTQVAGFNQFFDDVEGADAWRYGLGVDQQFSRDLYGGAEWSLRQLTTPGLDVVTQEVAELESEEQLARAYLYWVLGRRWAVGVEYGAEKLERDQLLEGATDSFLGYTTHRASVAPTFFGASGLSATLVGTYIRQSGDFVDMFGVASPGRDQFFTMDAILRFRLPRRWGLLSIAGKNIFDQEFRFQDLDPQDPAVIPGRRILTRLSFFL